MPVVSYQPPKQILEVLQRIECEEPLTANDDRYVDTQEARGSQRTLDRLARKFGLLLSTGQFLPPAQKHVLFFGHFGSGKTTERKSFRSSSDWATCGHEQLRSGK